MQFEIEKDSLLEGLLKTVPIAEKRSPLPILSHLLMNASEDTLTLTATDLEVGIEMIYNCNVIEPGIIAVPSKKFLEIVRELTPGIVRIELADNQRMKIISGVSNFELAGMNPDDYPAFATLQDVPTVSVHSSKLSYMIEKTLFAASNDESRFNLNGVLVEHRENKTRMVSTDGHRLALADGDLALPAEGQYLVPKKGFHELKRLLEGLDQEVLLGFEPKNLFVKSDKFIVTIRLMDGDYPPYQKVIPLSSERVVKVDRSRLIQALRRVATLASDRNKGMVFTVMPDQLELSISHSDFGTARDAVPVNYDGERFEVFVNVYYMLEALHVLDTEEVIMEFNPENSPIVMRPDPAKDFFNLVMPMRK